MDNCFKISRESSLFKRIEEEFKFNFDVYADQHTRKADMYLLPGDEPIKKEWDIQRKMGVHKMIIWCCPPTGKGYAKWAKKCWLESIKGSTVVGFFPASTDTIWFKDFVHKKAEVKFITGRLKDEVTGKDVRMAGMLVIWERARKPFVKTMDV